MDIAIIKYHHTLKKAIITNSTACNVKELEMYLVIILIVDFCFSYRTDVDILLDDIVAKEPLITPSKMEQVRKLILSILR